MPHFWRFSHKRRRQDSGEDSLKAEAAEIAGIVLRVDNDEERQQKVTKLLRKPSARSLRFPTPEEQIPPMSDVAVVGAGPAGLMLAANLIRFGINVKVIDNRSERTATGRADGLQPKTIETLRQMRLADRLLLKGVKVYDIKFWRSTLDQPLHRIGKEVHFPTTHVDALDPYLLLAHQGFVEDVFLKDMLERGADVNRNLTFVDYKSAPGNWPIELICKTNSNHAKKTFMTRYLVGCDGAHSNVRRAMGARQIGSSTDAVWGVLDGVLETDFPDIYNKAVIHSAEAGSVLLFPRERNMTRLYIELRPELRDGISREELSQEYVMDRAAEIFEPYTLRWNSIEWFGRYQIGRKIASKFQDDSAYSKVFIAGDATHTNSPKSQGMNTSIHDSWNLAWKLNLAIRGLAKPCLLATYEEERRQVAEDLLDYDHESVSALNSGDTTALAENFQRNIRFTSGFGADYGPNILNVPPKGEILGHLRAGSLLPPAKVTRFIDSNPVDIQLDIPMLGQFRIFFFTKNINHSIEFLETVSAHALTGSSVLGRATRATNASYTEKPPFAAISDDFIRPERYTPLSGLFTFALVLQTSMLDDLRYERLQHPDQVQYQQPQLSLSDLPPLWRESAFTVYLDDAAHLDTRGMSCTEKWLGHVSGSEVGIVVVRPDGYVGTMYRSRGSRDHGLKACKHLDQYFAGFLNV